MGAQRPSRDDGEGGVAVGVPGLDDLRFARARGWGERRDYGAPVVLVRGDSSGEYSLDEQGDAVIGAVQGAESGEQLEKGPVVGILEDVALDVGLEARPSRTMPIFPDALSHRFDKLAHAAGVPDACLHRLRHRDPSTTMRNYADPSPRR